jgi:uncharacterized protein YegP (UPF0339 family)
MPGSTILREHHGVGVTTPLFTRHMLGVIELERDERRRRRAAIRGGTRYEPVPGVVEPRLAAVPAPAARETAPAALDIDRWVDEGGSLDARRYPDGGDEAMQFVIYQDNGGRFHWRLVGDDGGRLAISVEDFGTADEARLAAADVHEHAGAAAGTSG